MHEIVLLYESIVEYYCKTLRDQRKECVEINFGIEFLSYWIKNTKTVFVTARGYSRRS